MTATALVAAYRDERTYHASTWRRLAALLIDYLVLYGTAVFIWLPVAYTVSEAAYDLATAMGLAYVVLAGAYFVVLWMRGGTLGMRAMNLHIVNRKLEPPSFGSAVVRLVTWVILQGLLTSGIFLVVFLIYRMRGLPMWHDTSGQTYVMTRSQLDAARNAAARTG